MNLQENARRREAGSRKQARTTCIYLSFDAANEEITRSNLMPVMMSHDMSRRRWKHAAGSTFMLVLYSVLLLVCGAAQTNENASVTANEINSPHRTTRELEPSSPNTNTNTNATTSISISISFSDPIVVSLEFSIWHPGFTADHVVDDDPDRFYHPVLATLREFLCQEVTDVSLIDTEGDTLCGSNDTNLDTSFHRINGTILVDSPPTTGNSTTATTEVSMGTVAVSDQRNGSIVWTSWEVSYQVVQVDRTVVAELEGTQQGLLDDSIRAQPPLQIILMNTRLQYHLDSSRVRMSVVGEETKTFQASWSAFLQESDFNTAGKTLRYIGISMLFLNLGLFVVITNTARRSRLTRQEQEQDQKRRGSPTGDSRTKSYEDDGALATEDSVNFMLAVGRDESMRAMMNGESSSQFLRVARLNDGSGKSQSPGSSSSSRNGHIEKGRDMRPRRITKINFPVDTIDEAS